MADSKGFAIIINSAMYIRNGIPDLTAAIFAVRCASKGMRQCKWTSRSEVPG